MNLGWILLFIAVFKARITVKAARQCNPYVGHNPDPSRCAVPRRVCKYEECYFTLWPKCVGKWQQGWGNRCGGPFGKTKWCFYDKCIKCKSGYFLDRDKCWKCQVISNCEEGELECPRSKNSDCSKCKKNYYLTDTKKCSSCPEMDNCSKIKDTCPDGKSSCDKCNDGFYGVTECNTCPTIDRCSSVECSNDEDSKCKVGFCDEGFTGSYCNAIFSDDGTMLLNPVKENWEQHKNTVNMNVPVNLVDISSQTNFDEAAAFLMRNSENEDCNEVWIGVKRDTGCAEADKRKCYKQLSNNAPLWPESDSLWLNNDMSKDYVLITTDGDSSKLKAEDDDYQACALYGRCKRYKGISDRNSVNKKPPKGLSLPLSEPQQKLVCGALHFLPFNFQKDGGLKLDINWANEANKEINPTCMYTENKSKTGNANLSICGYKVNFEAEQSYKFEKQGCLSCKDKEQTCSLHSMTEDVLTDKELGCFNEKRKWDIDAVVSTDLFRFDGKSLFKDFPWVNIKVKATGNFNIGGSRTEQEKGGTRIHDESKSFECSTSTELSTDKVTEQCEEDQSNKWKIMVGVGASLSGEVALRGAELSGDITIGSKLGIGVEVDNDVCRTIDSKSTLELSVAGKIRIFFWNYDGPIIGKECSLTVGGRICDDGKGATTIVDCTPVCWFKNCNRDNRRIVPLKTSNAWVPVAGRGHYNMNTIERHRFNAFWKESENQILRRICDDCEEPYNDIFYRRFDTNGLPKDLDLLSIMTVYWKPGVINNEFNNDFKIYSNYKDAKNDVNEWTYCDPTSSGSQSFGFPYNCGPTKISMRTDQWSIINKPTNLATGKSLFFNDEEISKEVMMRLDDGMKDVGPSAESTIRKDMSVVIDLEERAFISLIKVYNTEFTSEFKIHLLDDNDITLETYNFRGNTTWPLQHIIHEPILATKVGISAMQEMNVTEIEVYGIFETYSNPNEDYQKFDVVFYVENGESTCALYDIDNVVNLSDGLSDSDLEGCDMIEDDVVESDETKMFSTSSFIQDGGTLDKFDLNHFVEAKHIFENEGNTKMKEPKVKKVKNNTKVPKAKKAKN